MSLVKRVILLIVVLLSASLVCGATFLMPERMLAPPHVFPDNFPGQTLDQAIHNETVMEGDTIIVRGGTWSEHLNISKPITLEGGFQGQTILDGGGKGTVVDISVGNVTVNYFTIRNGDYGIEIGVNASVSNCTLTNNLIVSNDYGILIEHSPYNTLVNNNLTGNYYNFGVIGDTLQDFIQDIKTSNTVNNRPIYYWTNRTGGTIPQDAGYAALVNSTGVNLKNLSIAHSYQGLLLAYTNTSIIENNSLSNNVYGIYEIASEHNEIINNDLTNNAMGLSLHNSTDNTVVYNYIAQNGAGLEICYSNNNTLYRNNLVTNNQSSSRTESSNTFDNGREGNYWDDYVPSGQGKDVDGDGIGDTWVYGGTVVPTNTTPYNGVDYRPLMEPWQLNRTLSVYRYSDRYDFFTLSNSTVVTTSVNWNSNLGTIGFNMTSGTAESINVTIPRNWLDGPFEIRLNRTKLDSSSFSVKQDNVSSYLFWQYSPGTYMVQITGARVLRYRGGDINGDGIVDLFDAIILSNHFNKID